MKQSWIDPPLFATLGGMNDNPERRYGPKPKPLAVRFWPKVDRSGGPDACWPWTGGINTHGYGALYISGHKPCIMIGAHRVSWELAHGPIPDGMFVLHHCDNPPCVNPDHLFLGTPKDNMQDKVRKGRANILKKLDERMVVESRTAYSCGDMTKTQLARKCGVTFRTISLAIDRLTWSHIP